ncbi:hypothetical protein NKJ72_17255 [Mesorhizobium sp. M0045]
MEWDPAAGDSVLRAAGGMTRTLDGQPLACSATGATMRISPIRISLPAARVATALSHHDELGSHPGSSPPNDAVAHATPR